jgi:ice-binding like protein
MTAISCRGWHGRTGSSRLTASLILITTGAMFIAMQSPALAATAPPLGSAATFGVLAATTVTNTGSTVVNGDLGLWPGTSVTGFTAGSVTGAEDINDTAAQTAQADLTTAYNNAAGQAPTTTGVSAIGGGPALTPGVYNAPSSLGVTGTVTLDGQGNPNAVFIFQVGSALTTASTSTIALINGAQACNVFWQVGSSATLGTGSSFAGNILALTSITVTTGDTVDGSVLAQNGAVTLDDDTITAPTCMTTQGTPLASPPGIAAAAGISGLAGLGWFLLRRRRTAALA